MTISSTVNRKEYTGNGVTRTFSFPYYLLVKADLKVYVAGTLKTLDTHYTITGTPSAGPWPDGVTVTFPAPASPPASSVSIVIIRDPAITQGVDLVENDDLPVESAVEQPLDRLTMIAQRLAERVDRSFALSDTDISGASTVLPTPEALTIIGWDDDAGALVNYSTGDIGTEILVSSFMETVLDDATAADARTTLGVPSTTEAILGTIMDAKGDLIAASAADTPALVSVGADGTVLTADSTATAGVSWQVSGFTTGDVKLTLKTVADTGWVLMDDKTIGDASSSATGRANADTEALFTLLWANTADADCAVSSGRGASAAQDFAAHKTLALPKALGRALAVYGSGSGLTARALAHVVGEEMHLLTGAESGTPVHTHTASTTSSFPVSDDTVAGSVAMHATGAAITPNATNQNSAGNQTVTSSTTVNNASAANASSAHENMQPTVFLNVMVKL